MKALAIAALLATIVLGAVVGVLYLQRAQRHRLVKLHLWVGLAATALVLLAVLTVPAGGGPSGVWPVVLVALAAAGGWSALRYVGGRRRTPAAEFVLGAHAVVGVAGFLVLLAALRTL
jgi:hypothetical protein